MVIAQDFYKISLLGSALNLLGKKELRQIAWVPPPEGWIKVNTDSAYSATEELATAGGLIRDNQGNFIEGFTLNVGSCNPLSAEPWAILHCLQLAWDRGFRNVIMETDYLMASTLVKKGIDVPNKFWPLTTTIKSLLSLDWNVRVEHVFRECNRAVDWLTKLARTTPIGSIHVQTPPEELGSLLNYDRCGGTTPRLVTM